VAAKNLINQLRDGNSDQNHYTVVLKSRLMIRKSSGKR
jgi:hypothetical protein